MIKEVFDKSLQSLVFQRNVFLTLTLIMSLSIALMGCFLFTKSERVIVTPVHVEKEFWVEGNKVSATYLEQYGQFVSQLLLQKSSQSAAAQRAVLLRNTDAAFVGDLKGRLIDEEAQLKKQNASYVFFPTEISVDPELMQVRLKGNRACYVAGTQVSQANEGYILSFKFNGSRLVLSGVSSMEKK